MANNNRFIVLGSEWQLSADGETIGVYAPVSSLAWGGDVNSTVNIPTLGETEAGTIVHAFLPETYYMADDPDLYVCVSADTFDDTGIDRVEFNYGGAFGTVSDITQRVQADGTLVQGYWIRLDNSAAVPTGYEDRTLYVKAVANGVGMTSRVVKRTIRVLQDASQVTQVTLSPNGQYVKDHTPGHENDTYTLQQYLSLYDDIRGNTDTRPTRAYVTIDDVRYYTPGEPTGTPTPAVEFILKDGAYFMGSAPSLTGLDANSYRRVRSENGDRQAVRICHTGPVPGTTDDDVESFWPYMGDFDYRNMGELTFEWTNPNDGSPVTLPTMTWNFQDITFDMYQAQKIAVGDGPLTYERCDFKDSAMSYSKTPTGRPPKNLRPSERNALDGNGNPVKAGNPYGQVLFRSSATQLQSVGTYDCFINTICGGGLTSIFNCTGALWWDTLFIEKDFTMGVNNFRHITTWGTNLGPGGEPADLETERMVTNTFGPSTGYYVENGYTYPFEDGMGEDSIDKGVLEVDHVAWVGTNNTFYASLADLRTAGTDCLEFRVYTDRAPTSRVPRYGITPDGYPFIQDSTHFYDWDFFVWRADPGKTRAEILTEDNRLYVDKNYKSSAFCASWHYEETWGGNAYPQDPIGSRVVANTVPPTYKFSMAPQAPTASGVPYLPTREGEGLNALDPLNMPYVVFFNEARYPVVNCTEKFDAVGLDASTDTIAAYYATGAQEEVYDTFTPIGTEGEDAADSWALQPGDYFNLTTWAHQDGFQTANGDFTLENCIFHDYISVMEQQFLYQASGAIKDVVWSNALFLDPKDVQGRYLIQIQKPEPMRLGYKNLTTDDDIQLSTAGRINGIDEIKLWIESSNPAEVLGTTSGPPSSEGGVGDDDPPWANENDVDAFGVTIKNSIMGQMTPYWNYNGSIGKYNEFVWENSVEIYEHAEPPGEGAPNQAQSPDGYARSDGSKAMGISKYGAMEIGSPIGTAISNSSIPTDLTSVLPYDIFGKGRTVSSYPGAIDDLVAAGDVAYESALQLPFNRFRVAPYGPASTSKRVGDTAEITNPGTLLSNDGAARSYTWRVNEVTKSTSNSYTIVPGDVGGSLSCQVTADGASEMIAFGVIKPAI